MANLSHHRAEDHTQCESDLSPGPRPSHTLALHEWHQVCEALAILEVCASEGRLHNLGSAVNRLYVSRLSRLLRQALAHTVGKARTDEVVRLIEQALYPWLIRPL